ncbi:MAG: HEAT repeat domain-containing protein [Ignavibacteriaceae bacterium]|nr:HEAT repeat domain-containing protein [Ignavibacteriaceae bacterium]
MEHKKFEEMLMLYSWNELKKDERNEFERHMLGCDSCRNKLEELKQLNDLVTANVSEEIDENALFESRQELLAEVRNLNRKKNNFFKIWEFITTPSSRSLKFAYTIASIAILFSVGYFAFVSKSSLHTIISKNITQSESSITNLQFLNSNFEKGEVEISYEQVTPVMLKGNVNDPQIQKVLAQSLIDNENPGVRLKTVNAILSEKPISTTNVLKDALIKAMKYDDNPGVRREAMNALCNLHFDTQIRDALIHVLQNDKNSGLRVQAINCLDLLADQQKIKDQNTINVLKKKIEEDENSYIKLRAKTILTKLES